MKDFKRIQKYFESISEMFQGKKPGETPGFFLTKTPPNDDNYEGGMKWKITRDI